jgi:glycogen operon protein
MANAAEITDRLCAKAQILNCAGRKPYSHVNFIAAHDGFTLNDLVCYNAKHNEANGGTARTDAPTTTRGTVVKKGQ